MTSPVNVLFGTRPLVFHAAGKHDNKPAWPRVKCWFEAQPMRRVVPSPRIRVITCNNGHPDMGLFERSCAKLGLDVAVTGQGIDPWENARDKPGCILAVLERVTTPFVLYVDSRDGILVDDPDLLVSRVEDNFPGKELVFGADRLNWPPIRQFKAVEDRLAAGSGSDFRYLNGGAWIGRTEVAWQFFAAAAKTAPHPEAPTSEQGILKSLLADWSSVVAIDYRCDLIQNLGFALDATIALA
jgi:hypothetical protein